MPKSIRSTPCSLSELSGSDATCFGLTENTVVEHKPAVGSGSCSLVIKKQQRPRVLDYRKENRNVFYFHLHYFIFLATQRLFSIHMCMGKMQMKIEITCC